MPSVHYLPTTQSPQNGLKGGLQTTIATETFPHFPYYCSFWLWCFSMYKRNSVVYTCTCIMPTDTKQCVLCYARKRNINYVKWQDKCGGWEVFSLLHHNRHCLLFLFFRANVLKSKGVTHIDIQQLQNFENGIFNKSSGPVSHCRTFQCLMLY